MESKYAPAALLPSRGIKLQNGKVTCLSCHDITNPESNHLIRVKFGGSLCKNCHIRQ